MLTSPFHLYLYTNLVHTVFSLFTVAGAHVPGKSSDKKRPPLKMDESPPGVLELAREAVQYLRVDLDLPPNLSSPVVGIICGSGLGGLASSLHAEPRFEANYSQIPHFPRATGEARMVNGLDLACSCLRRAADGVASVGSGGSCGEVALRPTWLSSHSSRLDGRQATVSAISPPHPRCKIAHVHNHPVITKVIQSTKSHSRFE